MKHFNSTLVAFLLSSSLFAQVPSNVPTDGLVGWWPFTGNADDLSGNGNHGMVTGATLTEDRFGLANGSYSFNGAGYITINNALLPATPTSFTISIWFSSNTLDGMLISDRGTNINWFKYMVGLNANVLKAGNYSSGCNNPQALTSPYADDQWNHVVTVKDFQSGIHTLYLNGNLVAQESLLCYHSSTNGTSIGRWVGISTDGYYEGLIDDIGFWNRALTTNEINALNDINTSADERASPVQITAYPNPTTGSIRLTNIPQGTTPQLYDATGRNLLITTQRKGQDAIFDLGTYPAGLYFIRAGDRSFTIVRE